MKKNHLAFYVLRISLILLVITASVALALAGVNAITEERISQQKQEKLRLAMEQVLPQAGALETVDFTEETGTVQKVYAGQAGFVVQVAPSGFGGAITMMVGILPDGTVNGISVVSHTETAGLGAVAAANTAAGESFRGQFVGAGSVLSVDKDGGTVDSITGATITSRAITSGVNAALGCVAALD